MRIKKGYYGSPRWSWEVLDCAMPMTFDTYSNCSFQCVYCFSFFQRAIGDRKEDYLSHMVKPVNVEKVKRMFTDPENHGGSFKQYILDRKVLQWGGLSDGFDYYEKKMGKSLELLKFFNEINYPVSISTKGTWFLSDEQYIEQFKNRENVHVKYSIITNNEQHVKKIEMGVPSTRERFNALKKLKEINVGWTTWRFRPFIIGTSDINLEESYKMASDAGVNSMTVEFLCLERKVEGMLKERTKVISDCVGFDVSEFYVKNSTSKSSLMRLNYDIKRKYFGEMIRLADKYKIAFFVSDAHHRDKGHSSGCCGLPDDGVLSNKASGHFGEALLIAKKNGKVSWDDIKDNADFLRSVNYSNNIQTNTSKQRSKNLYKSLYDYMLSIWNDTKRLNNPSRYFGGVLVPVAKDKSGNLIFAYNEPFVENSERINDLTLLLKRQELFEELKQDGMALGHVAFPIYIKLNKENKAGIKENLDKNKINYEEASSSAVAKERAKEEKYFKYWFIDFNKFTIPKNGGLRGYLSKIESQTAEHSEAGLELKNG